MLPIFPLELVLLPGAPLPLHIFEDRYKEMLGDAVRNKTEFGVVQSAEQGIVNIGCSATVEKVVNEYPDGRMDLIALGRRRFEVHHLDQSKEYLQADVTFFDDEDDSEIPPMSSRVTALAGLRLLIQLGEVESEAPQPLHPRLSFEIARHLNDLDVRQTLLAIRSEAERLRILSEFLPEYIAKARRSAHIRRVAPTNGHGFVGHHEAE